MQDTTFELSAPMQLNLSGPDHDVSDEGTATAFRPWTPRPHRKSNALG